MFSMASGEEPHRRRLQEVLSRPGNGCCSDCGAQ
ncbi:arf-GAP with dual PH domain-containing protein 1, partial [Tachysurus ichikawai]